MMFTNNFAHKCSLHFRLLALTQFAMTSRKVDGDSCHAYILQGKHKIAIIFCSCTRRNRRPSCKLLHFYGSWRLR